MKRILFVTLAVLVCICSMFSGCTLIETNVAKDMDTVVATVKYNDKNTIEIKKQELLNYYYNYYETYVSNYGYTEKKALEACLDLIINQELLVAKIKEDEDFALTQNDKNAITLQVFDYVEEKISGFIDEIKNDWGIEGTDVEENQSEEKTYATKDKFKPTFEYVYDYVDSSDPNSQKEWQIKYVQDNKSNTQNPELSNIYNSYFWMESESQEVGFASAGALKSKITQYSDGVREEAMKRFVKELKVAEEYRNYKKNTSYDIFMREFNRVYQIYEDNKYIQKLEDWFNKQFVLSTENVLNYMKYQVQSQQEMYDDNNGIYKAYNEAMKSDASKVYYHPTNSWFNVSHVLIGYSDEQKAQIEKWDEQVKNGIITKKEYDANIESMKSQVMGQARDSEGKLIGEKKSAIAIYNEINSALNALGSDSDLRIKKFDEFIYKYSTDEGTFNATTDYAIPFDSTYDTMVEEFATESRNLYNSGVVGAMSGIVMSKYGAHIIIYTGTPKNIVNDINTLTINDLLNHKLKASNDKTMFDVACDGASKSDFATYQSNLVSILRDGKSIKLYKSRYEDIYKK